DFSTADGTIDMVFQAVGTTTDKLALCEPGDCLLDVVGPLGRPTEMTQGRVACVGGGVGIAALYPIARAFVEAGSEVRIMLGGRG
ncbi:MAG: sulfide/dihydroorotate dehydrogenase-like FAD/NAD-binding protein, partial [Pseudomonadota bacterium]